MSRIAQSPEWFHSQTTQVSAQKAATLSGEIPISPRRIARWLSRILRLILQKEKLQAAHSECVRRPRRVKAVEPACMRRH